ncbi:hypothetical protein O1611_g5910 [Lasiodiplodia mahajangana]|uniref:Uncharacterized protein n=1 Tax=Lasiodiplodia mahajangana TaxID=1108764 RepID=A0ACC2JJP6_9PEZI|nr:hypothetical protein O1611_g5910 [Lasiodiplodia mahajangana]
MPYQAPTTSQVLWDIWQCGHVTDVTSGVKFYTAPTGVAFGGDNDFVNYPAEFRQMVNQTLVFENDICQEAINDFIMASKRLRSRVSQPFLQRLMFVREYAAIWGVNGNPVVAQCVQKILDLTTPMLEQVQGFEETDSRLLHELEIRGGELGIALEELRMRKERQLEALQYPALEKARKRAFNRIITDALSTMPSLFSSTSETGLPTVQLHALSAGHFTLPEEQFVHPSSPGARKTVPSLAFLMQHFNTKSGKTTRIVFDLGLRRVVGRYSEPIQRHLATRQPLTTDPDVVKSLAAGGLTPNDIDFVFYSHVHWDHVGEPEDFPQSTFVVGHGALDLLAGRSKSLRGSHSFFEPDLLDPLRTIELSDPAGESEVLNEAVAAESLSPITINVDGPWEEFEGLPAVLDIFQDGSLYVVDAPGHLPGHINLLARTLKDDGSISWAYLAGDACHDRRILRREKDISEWLDVHGQVCCIHADRARADETIERVRQLEAKGVEVILAHDVEWEGDVTNARRFFGTS